MQSKISMERPLVIAFGLSVACHSLVLGLELMPLRGRSSPRIRQALELIYEYQLAEEDLRRLHQQLAERVKHLNAPPGPASPLP